MHSKIVVGVCVRACGARRDRPPSDGWRHGASIPIPSLSPALRCMRVRERLIPLSSFLGLSRSFLLFSRIFCALYTRSRSHSRARLLFRVRVVEKEEESK